MPFFYISISGSGIIEAPTQQEAEKIIKDFAGCYSSVYTQYECDEKGMPIEVKPVQTNLESK